MSERIRNKAGFTLAELLMSIAIVLVLAAIAIPSIVTAQNNMRMVELNNAAQSIANAAQAQMTAMKVSGTWLQLIDNDDGAVKYPQAKNAPDNDTFYMVAGSADGLQGARDNGVLPGLSIDDTVRNGDFVIVFKASTASVAEVFFADGKSGFFGEAPASTSAAQVYYESGAASTDQAARMKNDPMIGYYQGTPSGATPEVALKNPVIYVDEKTGCLMIQDPNISEDGKTGDTATTVRIEDKTQNVVFEIAGLSAGANTLTVSSDGVGSLERSGEQVKKVLKQVKRDGADGGNVFSIDLNALADLVDANADDAALKTLFAACRADDDLAVKATTKNTKKSSVPAVANANIKWPGPVGKLALLVTNPYSPVVEAEGDAYADSSKPDVNPDAYKLPKVEAVTKTGDSLKKPTAFAEDKQHALRNTAANKELVKQNKQAGYQSYTGGWIASSDVKNDETFQLKATVGSYDTYAYQIWELWIKRGDNGEMTRVGYINDNKWEWAKFAQGGVNYDYSFLDECFTWYSADGTEYASLQGIDPDAANITSAVLNAQAFYAAAAENPNQVVVDEDGNATFYIRTAPKASDVRRYFDDLAKQGTLASVYLSADGNESSSRNYSASSGSVSARRAFEAQFGASSSDVSWVVSRETDAGFDQGSDYLKSKDSVRVYYSIAPGVGFENIRTYRPNSNTEYLTEVRSTRMTNVLLWLYRDEQLDGKLVPMAPARLLNDNGFEYACRVGANDRYDFKPTTLEDYRFYRVLSYYDEDGTTKLDLPDQYVPHAEIANALVAGKDDFPTKPETDDFTYRFIGWNTTDVRNVESGSILCQPADSIEKHHSQLALAGTKFVASFEEVKKPKVSLGLAYLELDEKNAATGWYGYLGTESDTFESSLPTDNAIEDWGYFILATEGTERGAIAQGSGNKYKIADQPITVNLLGANLAAYRILAPGDSTLKSTATPIEVFVNKSTTTELHATYQVNFNFARALTLDANETVNWGKSASPWSVRHARQFPGSLKWHSNESVQLEYMESCFEQEHDIDMTAVSDIASHAYKFNNVFRGTYDGGNYRILNFGRATYSTANDANGFSVSNGTPNQGQGLFPCVASSNSQDEVLKNVRLVVDGGSTPAIGTASKSNFGFLVGNARQAKIVNCSLEGSDVDANEIAAVGNLSANTLTVSSLIGYAEQCQIEECKVRDVEVACSWKNAGAVDGLSTGLIVAQTSQVVLTRCTVANVTLDIADNKIKPSATVRVGGVVGFDEWGLSASYCEVSNVSFLFAENQNKFNKFASGSVVGAPSGACTVAFNTVKPPIQYFLQDEWISIDTEVGGSS